MFFKFLFVFLIFFLIAKCFCAQRNKSELFPENYCEMQCNEMPHTLCRSNLTKPDCMPRKTPIPKYQRDIMKHMLILGHNGLRNRIAERMLVANMVEMVWNRELALMARNFMFMCKPYTTDPCANLPENKTGPSYNDIAQNQYLQKNVHYPELLIENALRAWYMERDIVARPQYSDDVALLLDIGTIIGDNNYTHLAAPLITHFGCAFDKFSGGFLLVCNYYPYSHHSNLELDFLSGEPGTLCPESNPLKNTRGSWTNLCVGVERNPASTYKDQFLIILFALFFIF